MVLKAKVVEQERVDIRRPPPHTCVHVFFVYVLPVLDWEFHRRLGSKRLKNDIQAPKFPKFLKFPKFRNGRRRRRRRRPPAGAQGAQCRLPPVDRSDPLRIAICRLPPVDITGRRSVMVSTEESQSQRSRFNSWRRYLMAPLDLATMRYARHRAGQYATAVFAAPNRPSRSMSYFWSIMKSTGG